MKHKLMRSRNERMIAGIAAGLGRYLLIDPVIIRLAFVLLAFSGGIGLLFYPTLWLIMPREPAQPADTPALHKPGAAPQRFTDSQTDDVYYVKTSSTTPDVRFDPLTGEPLQSSDFTSVHNLSFEGRSEVDRQLQRNWVAGIILVAVGIYLIVQTTFLAPFILPALLIVGGIVLLLRKRTDQ